MTHLWSKTIVATLIALGSFDAIEAAGHSGQVTFGGLPVPGATVTATRGETRRRTVTDADGAYRLDLPDGVWTMRIEMLGFATITADMTIAADAQPSTWALRLLSVEEITRDHPTVTSPEEAAMLAAAMGADPPPTAAASENSETSPPSANPADAVDGLLVNGSVSNGAATPFAQAAAFGNNRRRSTRSLYTGGLGIVLGNSAWDARPFSFTGQPAPISAYTDVQVLGNIGGPVRLPRFRNAANIVGGYQRIVNHTATTESALVPTLLERGGDLSQTLNAFGQPVQVVDPATGAPFAGNRIPSARISPQAAALLALFPAPNLDGSSRYNYQAPIPVVTRQDILQFGLTQTFKTRNTLAGNVGYQRTTTDSTSLFGFDDASRATSLTAVVNWSYRVSRSMTLRAGYQFSGRRSDVTPYFAGRTNVSGDAGITGNDQSPLDWGPPSLVFSSGLAGLADAERASTRTRAHDWTAETVWNHGPHNLTFGGGAQSQHIDINAQQDARGTFGFTGAATGSDLADFLLGIPDTSAIAFGNADKFLRGGSYDAYANDDWRVMSGLTMNVGLRWEYESPMTERFGRLVNLDVAPGFTAVTPVVASDPVGPLTGQHYPDSLLRPDRRGIEPRLALAWRPRVTSSLVIRAGYGVSRNTAVYQSLATLLAQQPPLSKALAVENSAAAPLTLADGFNAPAGSTPNTFAIDPNFRVSVATNWSVAVQRDLPASLVAIATYLGASGSHLMQEFLPNTYPPGATNPCPTCPAGFIYLTSGGRSTRQAVQFELRRRLSGGLTATVQYTLAKAIDDAGAFITPSLSASAVAQNWLDLEAERGPSNFDQRHLLNVQVQYTSGMGAGGGGLLTGAKGSLVKGWTFTTQLTAGSGLPATPVYLVAVPGTGVIGSIRADAIEGSASAVPAGAYADPAAYAPPSAGQWGSAGRNAIRGPRQFSMNLGVSRTFPWGNRAHLDWRVDATNVLNRVTYASISAVVGSPLFGLPTRANAMRKVQTTLRLRF